MTFTFHVMFRQEPEGGFTVWIPSLPGCVSYGETLGEATTMIKEAAELYLETTGKRSQDIIDDSDTFESRLQIALPA